MNAFKDLTAGTFGGFALALSGHPLDSIKVRLQSNPMGADGKPMFTGMGDCFRKTIQQEGFMGLYKGVSAPLAGMALMNSILFFTYGATSKFFSSFESGSDPVAYKRWKERFGDDPAALPLSVCFLSGAASGVAVSIVESPQDLFKSQMQTQYGGDALAEKAAKTVPESSTVASRPHFRSVLHCAKHITSNYGLRGLYQGFSATLARNIPANSFYFGVFEAAKHLQCEEGQRPSDLGMFPVFLAGAAGGVSYWVFTFPQDVIKSKMQTDTLLPSERKYSGILDCTKQIWATEGVQGFFRGFLPCLVRSAPANACCFATYTWVKRQLDQVM